MSGCKIRARYHGAMRLSDVAIAALATARLTRFVVRDDLGKWWIKDPIDRAMDRYAEREVARAEKEGRDVLVPRWWKYRSGLDCPWCAGFWIALGVLATMRPAPTAQVPIVRLGMQGLAMNYLTTQVGDRLGDYDDGDDGDVDIVDNSVDEVDE